MDDLISRRAVFEFLTDEWDGNILHLFKGIKHIPAAAAKVVIDPSGIIVSPGNVHIEAERREE